MLFKHISCFNYLRKVVMYKKYINTKKGLRDIKRKRYKKV